MTFPFDILLVAALERQAAEVERLFSRVSSIALDDDELLRCRCDLSHEILIGVVDDLDEAGALRRLESDFNACGVGVDIRDFKGEEVTIAGQRTG